MSLSIPVKGGVSTTVNFTQDGAAVDPVAVRLLTLDPFLNKTTYTFGVDPEITNPAVGEYTATLEVTYEGTWYLRWESEAPRSADEIHFEGRETPFY